MARARSDLQGTMLELGVLEDDEPSRRPHGKVLQRALKERDPVSWNEWRRKHRKQRSDLRKIVLKGKYLGGLDLSNCVLDHAELERTDLRAANLTGSSFRYTNLVLSHLANARCDHAYFLPDQIVRRSGRRRDALSLGPWLGRIAWVITGGESGTGYRPMDLAWLRSLVDQCRDAGAVIFVKQDSGPRSGQQGRIPNELWVQEWPRL